MAAGLVAMMAAPILAYGRITTSDGIVIFGPTFSQRDGWHWRIEDERGPTTIAPWAEGDEMGGVLDRYRRGLEGESDGHGAR